jgi:FkbM family methyltransferase
VRRLRGDSISRMVKSAVRKAVGRLGLEIRRREPAWFRGKYPRDSLKGLLAQARQIGFIPGSVVDVGAAYGTFARECNEVFPEAAYVLVEPLEEYEEILRSTVRSLQRGEYILAAAGRQVGQTTIHVHPDLVGSSLYLEGEGSLVNGFQRQVPVITLDSLLEEGNLQIPILLKMDVQGAELDGLAGGEKMLTSTEYAVIETSLFGFFKGGPQLYDIIDFMKSRDFVPYDITGLQYRPLDNALSQVDIAFVKQGGVFRRHHTYATVEQREALNRRMVMGMKKAEKGLPGK